MDSGLPLKGHAWATSTRLETGGFRQVSLELNIKSLKLAKTILLIEAEVDLINASGLGVATIFRRDITISGLMTVKVIESIEYIGTKELSQKECMLTPWTLAQFDCCPGCEVIFPEVDASEVWDMYEPSDECRFIKDGFWHAETDGKARYQIGLSEKVSWIRT